MTRIIKLDPGWSRICSDSKLSNLIPSLIPSTPQKPKLVLAKNNPHLKSHHRRQSSQSPRSDVGSEKQPDLPGRLVSGMEHTKLLADVLYKRWTEGLSNRWPGLWPGPFAERLLFSSSLPSDLLRSLGIFSVITCLLAASWATGSLLCIDSLPPRSSAVWSFRFRSAWICKYPSLGRVMHG